MGFRAGLFTSILGLLPACPVTWADSYALSPTFGFPAEKINNIGQIVGLAIPAVTGSPAFVESNGTVKTFLIPGSTETDAFGINDAGQIVGTFYTVNTTRAYLDSGGVFTTNQPFGNSTADASGINNSGQIVGDFIDTAGVQHGYVDSKGVFSTIDLGKATFPLDINNVGQIVGYYVDSQNFLHGFLDSKGVVTTINVPGSVMGTTVANSINDLGQIVGYYTASAGIYHGYLDSNGVFTVIDIPGGNGVATGINDAGQIVVSRAGIVVSRASRSYLATPTVPEPSSLFLLACGLTGVGLVSRWKRTTRGNSD